MKEEYLEKVVGENSTMNKTKSHEKSQVSKNL